MKVKANIMLCKTVELEVDDKFRKLDGWHDISHDEEAELRDELETLVLESDIDCNQVSCVWCDDSDETLLEN